MFSFVHNYLTNPQFTNEYAPFTISFKERQAKQPNQFGQFDKSTSKNIKILRYFDLNKEKNALQEHAILDITNEVFSKAVRQRLRREKA